VTATFQGIQQRYIDAVNAATPLFDNLSPQTSQLNACTFIESYFWNQWGDSVMALTHEGHYYRRITDNAWTDGAHYRAMGRALARALIAYYNLPPSTAPATLTVTGTGPTLQLAWSADHLGWRLERQTNALAAGPNALWVTVPGSASTNRMDIPTDAAGSAFFRLAYP
jgi:hypothetical protein